MLTKEELYKKEYFELNEIIENLTLQEKEKIPSNFLENLKREMVQTEFVYDKTKSLSEQNIMVETKALLVELYNNYLANDAEKEILDKYRKISIEQLDKKKSVEYGTDKMFKNSNEKAQNNQNNENATSMVKVEHENVIKKLFRKIWKWVGNGDGSFFQSLNSKKHE